MSLTSLRLSRRIVHCYVLREVLSWYRYPPIIITECALVVQHKPLKSRLKGEVMKVLGTFKETMGVSGCLEKNSRRQGTFHDRKTPLSLIVLSFNSQ